MRSKRVRLRLIWNLRLSMVGVFGDTRVRLRLVDIAPLICRGFSSKRWIKRSKNPHPRSWYNFNYFIATFDAFSHIKICHFHMCNLNYITYNADLDHQSFTVGSSFPVLSSPWQTWFFASIILPFIFVRLESNSPTSIGTGEKTKQKKKKQFYHFLGEACDEGHQSFFVHLTIYFCARHLVSISYAVHFPKD